MKKWPRIGILVGFLSLLAGTPLAAFGQTQRQTFTQVWRHTDSIPQVEGDSIVLSWVAPDYERKSYGTLTVVQLGFDQQYLDTVRPMDVYVRLQVRAFVNADLDDYDPMDVDDTLQVMLDFHLGRRSEGAAKAALADVLLNRDLDHSLSALHTIANARKLTFIIDTILVAEGATYTTRSSLPDGIVLDVQLHWDLVPILDPSVAPIVNEPDALYCEGISEDPVELQVNWSPIDEAYEYHLEWTWSDTYTLDGTADGEGWFDLDRNATRVTIPKVTDVAPASYSYRIPLLFDRGFLVYRVRAMGRDPDNPQLPVYGDWSLDISSGVKSDVDDDDHFYEVTAAHRQHLNWQVTSTYAEEGKRKEVMTYADGSQRSRQMVTRNNSLLVPIIGETFYDLVGRPAVEAMPVPLVKAQGCPVDHGAWGPIDYYPLFNQARVEELDEEEELVVVAREYTYAHMTVDETYCEGLGTPMHPVNGAELYYNPAHMGISNALTGKPSFLPRAEGYPYSQTEYTRDNTGRVRRSSGVGDAFKLGSEHATEYFYGKPEQNKLDRLFGSEAGYANRYQKNVVFDPNGQGSVSYVDRAGRTVATALTAIKGSEEAPPTSVDFLTSYQNPNAAPTYRTDLFGGLSNLDCEANMVEQIDDSPALVFRDQIVVPANGLSYRFHYEVFPGLVEDSCMAVCLSCVYELSASLFDDCGVDMFAGWSTVIGSFKESGEFIFDCTGVGPEQWTEQIDLDAGEYQLIKILRVSSEARSAYVEEILANGDIRMHDSCFVSLDSLIAQHRAAVDISACDVTCASCLEELGELDDFLAEGRGTAQEYGLLREQCDQLCENFSWCDVAYRTMLEDMREMGQYGGVDHMLPEVNGSDRSSVYYFANGVNSILIQRGYVWDHPSFVYGNPEFPVLPDRPLWQQPKFLLEDDSYLAEYRDETGARTKVTVTWIDGAWTPAVENAAAVYPVEGSTDEHYTYPENLKRLADFLDYFQPGFERSLVYYHPEYCYWLDCRVYRKRTAIVDSLSSDAFDDKLRNATFQEALNYGWIDDSTTPMTIMFHWDEIENPDIVNYDPFVTYVDLYGSHAQQLRDKVAVYSGVLSMAEFAASMTRGIPGGIGGEFGEGWADAPPIDAEILQILNKEWLLFKTLYFSEKYRLQKQRRDAQMLTCGCSGVNYCIGEGDKTTWRNRMWPIVTEPPTPWTSDTEYAWIQNLTNNWAGRPIYMPCQPCGMSSWSYYVNKVPRFPDPEQFPGMGQSRNDLAYQNYVLTGDCPLASWIRMLLEELVQEELLDQSGVDLQSLAAGSELALITNMMGVTYAGDGIWNGGVAGPMLIGEIDLGSGGGGACPLMLTAATTYPNVWNSIIAIPTINANSDGSVELTIVYRNSAGEPITTTAMGMACPGLTNCKFKPICTTNELGTHTQDLFNMLAGSGNLLEGAVALNSTPLWPMDPPDVLEAGPHVQSLLPPYFLAQFGQAADLIWDWEPTGQVFALYADGSAYPRYEFAITGYDGMSVTDLPDAFEFRNLRASETDGFEVEVYEEDTDPFDTIPPALIGTVFGSVTLETATGTVGLAVGECGAPDMDIECKGLEFDVVEAYERVVRDYFQADDTWFTDGSSAAGNWDLLQHPSIIGELGLRLRDLNCPDAEILEGDLCTAGDDETTAPIAGLTGYTCIAFGAGFPTVCYPDTIAAELALANGRLGAPEPYGQPALDGSLHAFSMQLFDNSYTPLSGDSLAIVFTGPIAVQFCASCEDAFVEEEEDPMTLLEGFSAESSSAAISDPYAGFWALFGLEPPGSSGSLGEFDAESLDSEGFDSESLDSESLDSTSVETGNDILASVPSLQDLLPLPDFTDEDVTNILLNGSFDPFGGSGGLNANFASFGEEEEGCEFWALEIYNAILAFDSSEYAAEMDMWMLPYPPGLLEIMMAVQLGEEEVDCDCLEEGAYADYLQPYIAWTSPAPLPGSVPHPFEDLYECPISDCTMLYEIGGEMVEVPKYLLYMLYLEGIASSPGLDEFETFILANLEIATYEEFESGELCDCFEDYFAHLQTIFVSSEPNLPVILDPRTWSISLFCSTSNSCMLSFPVSDTATWDISGYLVYQLITYAMQSWLDTLAPAPMPDLVVAPYTVFEDTTMCDCLLPYIMRVLMLMSDEELSAAELRDERIWDIVKFCTPDPCAPGLPPHTPVIEAPEGNPCVEALYANAEANAHQEYADQIERIRSNLTEAYNATCMAVKEVLTMDYQDPEHHYTLYYYDQAGSLVRTVPPEGVDMQSIGEVDETGALLDDNDQIIMDAIAADRVNGTHTVFTSHRMPSDHVYNSLGNPIRSDMPDQDKMAIWETALPTGLPSWLNVTGSDLKTGGQGWLSGGREVGVHQRGYAYRTGDGGASWQRLNGLVASDLNAVHFPDDMIGYAVGKHGTLVRTVDMGTTWDMLPATDFGFDELLDVHFSDATTGVITGTEGRFWYTTDGADFTPGTIPDMGRVEGVGFGGGFFHLAGETSDGLNGFMATLDPTTWDWEVIEQVQHVTDFGAIHAVDEDVAFAGGMYGLLLKTLDAGVTWTTIATGTKEAFQDLVFVDDTCGVAVMDSAGVGVLRHTQDGGRNWLPVHGAAGLDLEDMVLYDRDGGVVKAVAVGSNGLLVRVLVSSNGVGVDRMDLSSLGDITSVIAAQFTVGSSDPMLYCVVGNSTGEVHFSWDVLSGVSWVASTVPGSAAIIKMVATGNMLSLLDSDGAVRVIDFESIISGVGVSVELSTDPDYTAIHPTDNGDLLLYNATSEYMDFIDMSSGPSYAITTNPNTGATDETPVAAMANMGPSFGRVVTVGAEGDIRWADQPVTDWEWTQALAQPLPMRTTAPSSPYAAGDEGALMFAVGSGVGFCLHSTINETLRGITDPNTTDDIYLAGDAGNGYVLSGDIAIELGLPTTLPLNDVLAFDDKVYMAANNGTILYQNAGGPWTVLPYNSGNIRGLAESGFGQVVAVGDHALVHRLSGTTRMAVQDVFPPALADVSMTEGGNGYVVGQDGFARYTANGGQTWSVVATNDPITGDFNAVRTKAQGDAIAVGSGGLAVHLQATVMTAIEEFGTHDLNAVAIAANGSAVIAGTNSGGHGVCYTLNAGDLILDDWVLHDASAISNLSGKAQHAAWAFQRTILTTGTPVNSFLIAGQAGSSTLLRFDDDGNYASATPITGVPSAGDITALYFHDQVAGYAGTNTGQLLRANTAVDHGSFAWGTSSLPTADGLNDQTNSSLIHIRTISFGSRHKGFLGGVYDDPAYLNYARIITDESGLYSQRLWYDKLGRVVLSQNTKQFNADPKQYSFTFYDELGRVFVAGQMADATGTARNIFGTDVQGAQQPFTIDQENLGIWLDSQLALDPYNLTEMVWTIYDEPGPDVGPFFTTGVQENLRLRVSYTMHAAQGFDIDHASAYSYDIHGNVKELVQYHPQLGVDGDANINAAYKHLKYTYDLISGNVKQVSYQGGQPDQFHHRYRYDADNRIERVETSRNGLTWREDARYFYYPHGPLQRVEIGDAKVQGVDYAYTLQGWLKGINSTLLLPENDMGQDAAYELSGNPNALIGRDVYGLSLGYYGDNDYAAIDETRWDNSTGKRPFAPMGTDGTLHTEHRPLYNGNINHTVNSLAPFGGYPDDPVAPGQVLAMVYKYDQLNRLKEAQGISQITTANTWHEVVDMDDQTIPEPILNKYKSEYWYDANGNIDTLARFDADGNQYDGFKYGYHVDGNGNKVRNRLYNIQEWIDDPYAPDIPHIPHQPDPMADAQNEGAPGYTIQDLNLYEYDAIGQRIRDKVRQITHIEWSTTGKMREVQVAPSSGKQGAAFTYDAGGNRIIKEIRDDAGTPLWREHYVRDAHGNIMAIYRAEEVEEELSLKVTDRPIYGSSRLGVDAHTLELGGLTFEDPNPYLLDNPIGLVKYELTDHLGNVAAVITDELLGVNVDGGPENEYFQPNLISASLYEPFGMNLTGTNWQSDVARFGFQGQLHDLELGFVHFKYREYDPSGSGFLTIDPLAADYPWNSPFAFSENRVIDGIDLEGLEHYSNKYLLSKTSEGKLQIEIISEAKQSYPGKNGWGVDARFYAKDDAGKMQEIPEFRIFIPQPKPFFHCNWSEGGPVFINGKELSFTASRAFEGKHGYDNGGRDAMLGTFSLVLGGASLYAGSVSPVWGIVGMVDSADELTGNEDGTLIERAFGEWGGRAKTAINIASLSTGLYKLINGNADPKRMKDAAETFFIDLSNVVKDTFDLLITPEPPKE